MVLIGLACDHDSINVQYPGYPQLKMHIVPTRTPRYPFSAALRIFQFYLYEHTINLAP